MGNYQQPAIANAEDKFVAAEHNGALLLFFPTALQLKVTTAHGECDAVATRVVNLENGRVLDNTMIFATALVTQLRQAVPDGMVLGRLGQGQNTKGNPPWLLSPYTEEDIARADAWQAANPPAPAYAQPAAQAAPPTAPAWGQQATAPAAPSWGAPAPAPAAPATGGWGAPEAAAPAGNGWGAPAAPAPASSPGAAWGAPAVAAPAPAAPAPAPTATNSQVHPGLVEALRKKGINLPPDATQQSAEGIWAVVQGNPDVA